MTFKYFKREYELSKLMDAPLEEDVQGMLNLLDEFFDAPSLHKPDIYLSKDKIPTLRLDPICSDLDRIVYLTARQIISKELSAHEFSKIVHFWFLENKYTDICGLSLCNRIE